MSYTEQLRWTYQGGQEIGHFLEGVTTCMSEAIKSKIVSMQKVAEGDKDLEKAVANFMYRLLVDGVSDFVAEVERAIRMLEIDVYGPNGE